MFPRNATNSVIILEQNATETFKRTAEHFLAVLSINELTDEQGCGNCCIQHIQLQIGSSRPFARSSAGSSILRKKITNT